MTITKFKALVDIKTCTGYTGRGWGATSIYSTHASKDDLIIVRYTPEESIILENCDIKKIPSQLTIVWPLASGFKKGKSDLETLAQLIVEGAIQQIE